LIFLLQSFLFIVGTLKYIGEVTLYFTGKVQRINNEYKVLDQTIAIIQQSLVKLHEINEKYYVLQRLRNACEQVLIGTMKYVQKQKQKLTGCTISSIAQSAAGTICNNAWGWMVRKIVRCQKQKQHQNYRHTKKVANNDIDNNNVSLRADSTLMRQKSSAPRQERRHQTRIIHSVTIHAKYDDCNDVMSDEDNDIVVVSQETIHNIRHGILYPIPAPQFRTIYASD
jgi:hypothetical protein